MTSSSVGDHASPTNHDLAIELAAEHFLARGIMGVVVEDIAAEAPNLAVRSELSRYPTKSALAVAVVTAAYAGFPFVTFQDNGVEYTGLTRIGICCHAVMHRFHTDTLARATLRLKREASMIDAQLPEPFTVWLALIEEMLDEAVEDGEIRGDVDTADSAWLLVSTFYGMSEVTARMQQQHLVHDRIDKWLRGAFLGLGAVDPAGVVRRAREASGR